MDHLTVSLTTFGITTFLFLFTSWQKNMVNGYELKNPAHLLVQFLSPGTLALHQHLLHGRHVELLSQFVLLGFRLNQLTLKLGDFLLGRVKLALEVGFVSGLGQEDLSCSILNSFTALKIYILSEGQFNQLGLIYVGTILLNL